MLVLPIFMLRWIIMLLWWVPRKQMSKSGQILSKIKESGLSFRMRIGGNWNIDQFESSFDKGSFHSGGCCVKSTEVVYSQCHGCWTYMQSPTKTLILGVLFNLELSQLWYHNMMNINNFSICFIWRMVQMLAYNEPIRTTTVSQILCLRCQTTGLDGECCRRMINYVCMQPKLVICIACCILFIPRLIILWRHVQWIGLPFTASPMKWL